MVSFLDRPQEALNDALRDVGLDILTRGRRTGPPSTFTRLDHSMTIRTGRGRTVGAINGWNPTQTRRVEEEFEVEVKSTGLPVDLVPQIVNSRTIRIDRYDLYTSKMEEAFGTKRLDNLTDQHQPFTVREVWRTPLGSLEVFDYIGCWFADLGRTHNADGNRIVKANATLIYKLKRQML